MNSYEGRGERRVKKILEQLFETTVFQQVPIKNLVSEQEFYQMSDEYRKHKFDLQCKNYIIEVNYKHKNKAYKKWDIFSSHLQENGFIPITIEDRECENLFKEPHVDSWDDYHEVINELQRQEVTPNGKMHKMRENSILS